MISHNKNTGNYAIDGTLNPSAKDQVICSHYGPGSMCEQYSIELPQIFLLDKRDSCSVQL